jgi:hypothetical protein
MVPAAREMGMRAAKAVVKIGINVTIRVAAINSQPAPATPTDRESP